LDATQLVGLSEKYIEEEKYCPTALAILVELLVLITGLDPKAKATGRLVLPKRFEANKKAWLVRALVMVPDISPLLVTVNPGGRLLAPKEIG
jgi:hypothetical protein